MSWTLFKLKTSAPAKISSKRIREQATDSEEIFAKDMSDKGLLHKIHEESLKQ